MPELPTKRPHAEVSVHPLAAPVSSADTILISKLKLACTADAVCTRKLACMRMKAMPFVFSLTCDGVNR